MTGYTAGQIAEQLNRDGWSTATQRNSFNERLVRMILHRYGTVAKGARRPPNDDPNDWWLSDLADEIEVPLVTLYGWMRRGWLKGRRVDGHWALRADRTNASGYVVFAAAPIPKSRIARGKTH